MPNLNPYPETHETPYVSEISKNYEVLNSPEKDLNSIAQLVSQICQTPIVLISIIDNNKELVKASIGWDAQYTYKKITFSLRTIIQQQPLVVRDTLKDEQFASNALVTSAPFVRFYAGLPLISSHGQKFGVLSLMDYTERSLSGEQLSALETLSRQITNVFELDAARNKMRNSVSNLKQQNNRLTKLNYANSKLLSILAHDLKNPLTFIKGSLFLFENDMMSLEEMKTLAKNINEILNNTSDLLDNLLQWAFAQFRGQQQQLTEINLHKLIEDKINKYKQEAKLKDIEMINEVRPEISIKVDENILRLVLRNIIINAIKFTREGSITFSNDENDDYVILKVTDTGVGIPSERILHLFNWDKRQSTTGTSGEKGSGLGLQISRELLEKNNGKIWVESEVGTGSTFFIGIPKKLPTIIEDKPL